MMASSINDVTSFIQDYESNDAVSKDEMLSSAGTGGNAAQDILFPELEAMGYGWGYRGAAEAVGSVGGAEAELHTRPPLPMGLLGEQYQDESVHAHSTNMNSMPAGTSSGYQGETKQEKMQRASATASGYDERTNFICRWPEMQRGRPDRNKLAGVFDFSIDAESNNNQYSTKKSTLFVDMNKNFTVNFKWNKTLLSLDAKDMYVRAIVMYGNEAHKQNRVTICANHNDFIEGVTPVARRAECHNVLRSASAVGSLGVHYCGAPDTPDVWYSVLTPLDDTHAYYMKCRGTCEPDMQRRLKQILFVLENSTGEIFGRDSLKVQVCAVPSRDMRAPGKRRAPAAALAPAAATRDCKRARTDATLTLPPIPVADPETMYQMLFYMKAMIKYKMKDKNLTPELYNAHNNTKKVLEMEMKKCQNTDSD